MDATFWLGIAIGGLVSLAASILANLHADRIRARLEASRSHRTLQRLDKEKETFFVVCGLINDMRKLNAFLARELARVIIGSVVALFYALIVLSEGFPIKRSALFLSLVGDRIYPFLEGLFNAFVLCAFCFVGWYLWKSFNNILTYTWRVENFEDYRDRLASRWPDEPWECSGTTPHS